MVQFGVREQEWPGGPFRGYDFPPGTFRRETAFAYRLENGRIAERWAIRDDLAMVQQLGGRPIAPKSEATDAPVGCKGGLGSANLDEDSIKKPVRSAVPLALGEADSNL